MQACHLVAVLPKPTPKGDAQRLVKDPTTSGKATAAFTRASGTPIRSVARSYDRLSQPQKLLSDKVSEPHDAENQAPTETSFNCRARKDRHSAKNPPTAKNPPDWRREKGRNSRD